MVFKVYALTTYTQKFNGFLAKKFRQQVAYLLQKKAVKYIVITFLGIAMWLSGPSLMAQRARSGMRDSFKGSQWYIGLESGMNFTKVNPGTAFQEFYRPSESLEGKVYGKRFAHSSQQIGIKAAVRPTKHLNISLTTSYITYRYSYQQQFLWEDAENPDQHVNINYDHTVRLSYLELPVIVRYYLYSSGRFRPYVLGGAYYGWLVQANKQIVESGIDRASGGSTDYSNTPNTTFVKDMFLTSQAGYLWGGGFAYKPGTVTLTVDIMYKQGIHNITDVKHRFSSARSLPGFGNVQDNLRLSNLQVSFSLLFPLKFLTKSFNPVTL